MQKQLSFHKKSSDLRRHRLKSKFIHQIRVLGLINTKLPLTSLKLKEQSDCIKMNSLNRYFRKVWFILGDSKKQLPLLLIIFISSSVMEAFGIGLLGPFFAIISDPSSIERISLLRNLSIALNVQSDEAFIALICLFIIVVFIVKSILYFSSKFYILHFSHAHRGKIIQTLNRAYLNSEYSYFLGKNSSGIIKNITIETHDFCYKILLSLLYGVSNLFILISLFVLMAWTDLLFLTATLSALFPVALLIYLMKDRLRNWGMASSVAMQEIIKTLNHGLGGFKETRIIGCAPYFESEVEEFTAKYARSASLSASFDMLPRIIIETSLVIFIVSFIAISQFLFQRDSNLLISSLSVFAVASIRLLPAASQVMGSATNIQNTRHVVDILYNDLTEAQAKNFGYSEQQPRKNLKPERIKNKIEIKNLHYRYLADLDPAINGISLEIKRGDSIAFIGKSGAGKTTLVDLILGLLFPQSGDITVDGVSIYDDIRSWQDRVGYIPQSIFLLDDTVARNIAFGLPDHAIDFQKLEMAISAAQLDDLIEQLPMGIHTRVGERGVMLSGGQRQRIGIARALYHERDILVLDEATSALDNDTEEKISKSIKALAGERTLITIAHRLSTVEHCDCVYMIEKGKIIGSGKLVDLLENKSLY